VDPYVQSRMVRSLCHEDEDCTSVIMRNEFLFLKYHEKRFDVKSEAEVSHGPSSRHSVTVTSTR
jgi:hypothetical protein